MKGVKKVKKQILTCNWSAQHPNAGQNRQQRGDFWILRVIKGWPQYTIHTPTKYF